MRRHEVLDILRSSLPRLQELGVKSIAVFGSTVRDELRADSDVDILVDFGDGATFDRYMNTKFFLEEILGRHVDLVTSRALKPIMRPLVEQEAVYVA